jgi:hypothetical protein
MPIAKEFRQFYGPVWRNVTRPRILARADNKCEVCGVPDRIMAMRAQGWWSKFDGSRRTLLFWYNGTPTEFIWTAPGSDGKPLEGKLLGFPREICRLVPIVLGVAHLNHKSGDDRDENLKALCQWCHLHYDHTHHRETRVTRKDRARPLLTMEA